MGPQVMIVDDDASTRTVIYATLSRLGYEARCAANGQEALTLIDLLPVDVVITDIFMPVMDGIELIIALKALIDPPKILAISGGAVLCGTESLRTARLLGADDVMDKPFSISALARVVGELAAARSEERAQISRRRFRLYSAA